MQLQTHWNHFLDAFSWLVLIKLPTHISCITLNTNEIQIQMKYKYKYNYKYPSMMHFLGWCWPNYQLTLAAIPWMGGGVTLKCIHTKQKVSEILVIVRSVRVVWNIFKTKMLYNYSPLYYLIFVVLSPCLVSWKNLDLKLRSNFLLRAARLQSKCATQRRQFIANLRQNKQRSACFEI